MAFQPVEANSQKSTFRSPLPPPEVRDLATWFPDKKLSPCEIWEIRVQENKGLSKSLALAYIYSMKDKTLKKQFEFLLGSKEDMLNLLAGMGEPREPLDIKKIKKLVMSFNPFINRSNIFFEAEIKTVAGLFYRRLQKIAAEINSGPNYEAAQKEGHSWTVELDLEATSYKLRDCRILVYETDDSNGIKTFKSFPKGEGELPRESDIVIFRHSNVSNMESITDIFSFGMTKENAQDLRLKALEYILERAGVNYSKIHTIVNMMTVHFETNFLLFLFESLNHEIIPKLYCSFYFPLKLSEAGFNTDPCCLNSNGLSAFFYCMNLEETDQFLILYNYAANKALQSDKATRSPRLEILLDLAKIIKNDYSKLNKSNSKAGIVLKFNDFQISFTEGCRSPKVIKPKERNNVISLLNSYSEYFYFDSKYSTNKYEYYSLVTESDPTNNKYFDHFIRYYEYHEHLDYYTCLLFFDNILKVKASDDDINSIVEAAFSLFMTVLGYKFFEKCEHRIISKNCKTCNFSTYFQQFRIIPFRNRLKFQQDSELLKDKLGKSSNTQVKIYQKIIDYLKAKPKIKDEFLITRLIKYCRAAINVRLDRNGMKGVLAIERALQMIGETLTKSKDENSVVGHLLSWCLEKNIRDELIEIRHFLSHYTENMHERKIFERNFQKFGILQEEIKTLLKLFEFVCFIQAKQFTKFILNIDDDKNVSEISRDTLKICKENWKKNSYMEEKDTYIPLLRGVLIYIQQIIQGENNRTQEKGGIQALTVLVENIKPDSRVCSIQCTVKELENFVETHPNIDFSKDTKDVRHFDELLSLLDKKLKYILEDLKTRTQVIAFDFPGLLSYRKNVSSVGWFSEEEMNKARKKVAKDLKKSTEILNLLKYKVNTGDFSFIKEVERKLNSIVILEENRQSILRELIGIEEKTKGIKTNGGKRLKPSIESFENLIDSVIKQNDDVISFSFHDFLKNEKNLNWMKATFPENISNEVFHYFARKLSWLSDRVNHLKNILIGDDYNIYNIWKKGYRKETKEHMRFLMYRRFMENKE